MRGSDHGRVTALFASCHNVCSFRRELPLSSSRAPDLNISSGRSISAELECPLRGPRPPSWNLAAAYLDVTRPRLQPDSFISRFGAEEHAKREPSQRSLCSIATMKTARPVSSCAPISSGYPFNGAPTPARPFAKTASMGLQGTSVQPARSAPGPHSRDAGA